MGALVAAAAIALLAIGVLSANKKLPVVPQGWGTRWDRSLSPSLWVVEKCVIHHAFTRASTEYSDRILTPLGLRSALSMVIKEQLLRARSCRGAVLLVITVKLSEISELRVMHLV